jgi:5-formaminoimidazole-4-carboxamide-1-beta-D-ribofuranosyl 5'-monophosphate synthetase
MCKFTETNDFLLIKPFIDNIDIEKSKLENYIEGFNYVYQYYDKSIAHETNFGRNKA